MTSYFSNFFFNFEVGQLHELEGFITEQTRENAKYMIPTKLQDAQKEVAQLQNFKKFSLLLYNVYPSPASFFSYIVLMKRKLIFFFEILAIFLTFALQKFFW